MAEFKVCGNVYAVNWGTDVVECMQSNTRERESFRFPTLSELGLDDPPRPRCQEKCPREWVACGFTFRNHHNYHSQQSSIATPPDAMFGPFRLTNPLSGGLLWYYLFPLPFFLLIPTFNPSPTPSNPTAVTSFPN